jgi:hypothetical protein
MGQMPANSSLPAGQQNPFQTFGQPMVANQPVSTQSQTLSGGVKSPNVGKPSQLNGIKHTLGLASSFGGGIMTGVSSPGGLYSLGLMGVGLTNYGLSNSFTRY